MADKDPGFLALDETARAGALTLLRTARTAALGTLDPVSGGPYVTRISIAQSGGQLIALVSDLSLHTRALRGDPRASLLVGDLPARGDPLAGPRLSLIATVRFLASDDAARPKVRADWLETHPKSALYVDFQDFSFVRFDLAGGHLNGGFARAFALSPSDLTLL